MIYVLVFLDPSQRQQCGSLKFFPLRVESFMVDAVVDDVDSGAFNPELFLDLVLRLLRKRDDVVVGWFDGLLGQLYRRSYGDAEFQGGDGLMHVMNYPNDWSSRYETGPPGDRVSNVINDNIRILGHPPHQQWCFQMYPESSSPSDDLKAVNNFLLL